MPFIDFLLYKIAKFLWPDEQENLNGNWIILEEDLLHDNQHNDHYVEHSDCECEDFDF